MKSKGGPAYFPRRCARLWSSIYRSALGLFRPVPSISSAIARLRLRLSIGGGVRSAGSGAPGAEVSLRLWRCRAASELPGRGVGHCAGHPAPLHPREAAPRASPGRASGGTRACRALESPARVPARPGRPGSQVSKLEENLGRTRANHLVQQVEKLSVRERRTCRSHSA